jgi:phage terminase Nu1 subunit (DNA packaging protein)
MATYTDRDRLAKALNLSPRRVNQLAKEGMPKELRGKYDLGACMLWYIRYLQTALEKKSATIGDENLGLNDQRVRGMRANAELKEMELAIQRGQTATLQEVRSCLSDLVLMTKARLMAIPPRLATEVMGEESRLMIQAKIEKAIKDALNQLADDGGNYQLKK